MKRKLEYTPDRGKKLTLGDIKKITEEADMLGVSPYHEPTVVTDDTAAGATAGRVKKVVVTAEVRRW